MIDSHSLELLRSYLEIGEYTFDFAVVFFGVRLVIFTETSSIINNNNMHTEVVFV